MLHASAQASIVALVALAALGGCGTFGDSVPPPGDPAAFDAFAVLPQVRDFVGPGAHLVEVSAYHVRSNGLQVLTDESVTANVRYGFLRPVAEVEAPNVPRGARPAASSLERIEVHVVRPEWKRVSRRGRPRVEKHHGMRKFRFGDSATAKVAPMPRCSLARMWAEARKRGVPATALGIINYDHTGYRFTTEKMKGALSFDHACNPTR
jgi:hypothetical protein